MIPKKSTRILDRAKLAISNALTEDVIRDGLLPFRYDEAKLEEGMQLYRDAFELTQSRVRRKSAYTLADETVKALHSQLKALYIDDLQLARIVFKDDAPLLDKLEGRGTRKLAIGSWLKQVNVFYRNGLEVTEIKRRLDSMGVTAERMKANRKLADQLEDALAEKESCKGEAANAVKERDAAVNRLKRWMSDFRKVVFIAFKGSQIPEQMGWTVKSG